VQLAFLHQLAPYLLARPTLKEHVVGYDAVADVYYGAENSQRRTEDYARIGRELELLGVSPVTKQRPNLRRDPDSGGARRQDEGTKGSVDLMLAATAIENNAVLVTHDDGLLDGSIPDLKVEDWY